MRLFSGLKPLASCLFAAISLLGVTQIGNASTWDRQLETQSLRDGNFQLDAQRTRIVTLDTWLYVQKVVVRSEERSSRSSFSVWANGEQRGLIEPGINGQMEIELRESVSALEFRNVTGSSQILDVSVLQSTDAVNLPSHNDPNTINNEAVLGLCRDAMRLSDQLRPYSSFADYGTFLLPIRKAAARSYAMASVNPGISQLSASLGQLEAQISSADGYLNQAFEMDAAFNLAIDFLTLRYRLDEILR